jgi:predicted transcriptional regulator
MHANCIFYLAIEPNQRSIINNVFITYINTAYILKVNISLRSKKVEAIQKQPPLDINKIAIVESQTKVEQLNELDISDLMANLKRIKNEEQELLHKRKELQATQLELQKQAIAEFDEKKNMIEGLKVQIAFLQKKCSELEQALGI